MDDPNITMEEYIRLEEEKARRHGRTFNWQTATFGKIKNYEDEDDHPIDFETEFPTIVFDNTLTAIQSEPTVCPPNENELDFRISLDESDDKDYTVIFDENSFSYKIISVNDLKKTDLGNDKPLSPNPTVDYFDDLDHFKDLKNEFPAIVYNDDLTSKSDLGIKPLINYEYMASLPAADHRHPWLRYQIQGYTEEIRHRSGCEIVDGVFWRGAACVREMSDTEMGLDVADTLCFQLGGVRRRMTWRLFILALGLHTEQEMAEARDFLGLVTSYVLIRDPVRRLCHMMIAYSILGRGQTPEKVTGVDLFYLRSMDRRTANVPHLLAQYLFRNAKGRKSGSMLLGWHFIGRLAMHFGLVSDEGLRGLQVVTRELPLVDLHKLGRLYICTRYDDTWDWVAQGPERQQAAAAGAPEVDKAGQAAEEVAPEIPAPAPAASQAPPPPSPAPQPRTMSQRIERLEEEVHDLRRDVVGMRGDVASFTTEQSRVSTWLISCVTQLMDASGQTYQPFDNTLVGGSGLSFRRRVRPRTGDASTSAAPHTDAQPGP
ncbi:hypothetical protein Tco_1390027 [Tanacetum coccineum]